ncbi:MAG: metal-dependent transcriptional regulator [Lentisphaeria bacterium]|nr:metal-dependent transcriptional regulator [Lentisphaeria bacterium]
MTIANAGLSAEMEDYLEAIADLESANGRARVRDIATCLSVRMPSVTQALRSLTEKGYVRYEPYRPPALTPKGKRVAAAVQRRHVVIRRFLMEVLHVEAAAADRNACRLEHAMDREVLEHLTQFMDGLT